MGKHKDKSPFPIEIFVSLENAGTDEEFLNVHEDANDAAEPNSDVQVAVYTRSDVGIVRSKSEFYSNDELKRG